MANMSVIGKGTITLGGKEIPYDTKMMRHIDLRFYPENPRIFRIVCAGDGEPSQEEIENVLGGQDYVKKLLQSIEANGGVTDALWVLGTDCLVLEGNSRLAAYRLLAKKDPVKWGKEKCNVISEDVNDDDIIALLCQYHIVGRKDWAPYEQAGMLWRRHDRTGISPERMAKELGMSANEIRKMIEVYSFMENYREYKSERWSYYFEYLKSRKIAGLREKHPELDEVVVAKIRSGEIPKAEDVRDKLTKIAAAGWVVTDTFIKTKNSFERCYEKAVEQNPTIATYNFLYKFRVRLGEPETKQELKRMNSRQHEKCTYELVQIRTRVDKLLAARKL